MFLQEHFSYNNVRTICEKPSVINGLLIILVADLEVASVSRASDARASRPRDSRQDAGAT